MTVIPNFILKRMYKSGSLRQTADGVAFEIINNLGPGLITKINVIQLNDMLFSADTIVLEVGVQRLSADKISEENPATFFLNQSITCLIRNQSLPPGQYKLTLDLISKEAGRVTLSVDDTLAA